MKSNCNRTEHFRLGTKSTNLNDCGSKRIEFRNCLNEHSACAYNTLHIEIVKRWRIVILIGVLLAIGLVCWSAFSRQSASTFELSLLKGVPIHEFRPVKLHKTGGLSFSQTIYYLEMDFTKAAALIDKEIPTWNSITSKHPLSQAWLQKPGPFQSHGYQVHIRRNRVDPHSMVVYGSAEDSKWWVTIWGTGDTPEPNILRGLWRTTTGNKRP